jgi:hypothetical protein
LVVFPFNINFSLSLLQQGIPSLLESNLRNDHSSSPYSQYDDDSEDNWFNPDNIEPVIRHPLAQRQKVKALNTASLSRRNTTNEVIDLVDSDTSSPNPIDEVKLRTQKTNEKEIEQLKHMLVQQRDEMDSLKEDLKVKSECLQNQSTLFYPDLNKFTSIDICDKALIALEKARADITEKRKRLAAEEELCVICMETKRDTVLVPCGHLQFCWGCVERLPNKNCPCCTVVYREQMKVYFN